MPKRAARKVGERGGFIASLGRSDRHSKGVVPQTQRLVWACQRGVKGMSVWLRLTESTARTTAASTADRPPVPMPVPVPAVEAVAPPILPCKPLYARPTRRRGAAPGGSNPGASVRHASRGSKTRQKRWRRQRGARTTPAALPAVLAKRPLSASPPHPHIPRIHVSGAVSSLAFALAAKAGYHRSAFSTQLTSLRAGLAHLLYRRIDVELRAARRVRLALARVVVPPSPAPELLNYVGSACVVTATFTGP